MGEPQSPHRLSKLALSPGPLRIIPLPRSNRQREGLEASGAVQRVLGGTQSLASDIEPLGPRHHPPPLTTSTSAVDGFHTCRWCAPRDDDDDFEAYSTVAIIDHRASTRLPDTTFPLISSTICRLMPPRNDAWIKPAGKDCRS
jgi:hypothetical protein